MKQYLEISIDHEGGPRVDILIAELEDLGFYAFQEEENILQAYILPDDFQELSLRHILDSTESFKQRRITEENWNQLWETGFVPVRIGDFVNIRSAFHPICGEVLHDLVITPKMSFGTGHHATTQLMIDMMERIVFCGKDILDFGTGTGVLAILAEKSGAQQVSAIDIDDWSITNAQENCLENGCTRIAISKAEKLAGFKQYHVILANINLQILLMEAINLRSCCYPGSELLLSGFLEGDVKKLTSKYEKLNFKVVKSRTLGGWTAVQLRYQ